MPLVSVIIFVSIVVIAAMLIFPGILQGNEMAVGIGAFPVKLILAIYRQLCKWAMKLPFYSINTGHVSVMMIDLNGKSVTLQMMNFDYSLYVKNGTLNCGITNGSVGFTNAMLTLSNVKFITDSINWMTKDGICLNNGSNVTLNGSQCWFEKLEMDTDCVFTVQNSDGLSNFGHIADGFDGVKEFVPEGLSVEGTTIIDDETGAKAKDFILRYRSLSDDADVAVSIDRSEGV